MSEQRLTALVTGASGGIGEELARLLAADRYDLVLVARSRDKLARLAEELGGKHDVSARVIARDLAAPAAPQEIFEELRADAVAVDGDKLFRARIHHRPWPLQDVRLRSYRSTMVEAAGLGSPAGPPLLHHGGPVDVEVWALEKV